MIFWRQLTHFEIQKSFRLRRSLWLVVWPSPNFFRTLLRKRLTQRLLRSFSSNLASNFTLPVFLISYHVRMYMYDVNVRYKRNKIPYVRKYAIHSSHTHAGYRLNILFTFETSYLPAFPYLQFPTLGATIDATCSLAL